jgi:hypothetical protein
MRRIQLFAITLLLLFFGTTSLVNAGITDWNCDDDGDGAIEMTYADLKLVGGEYTLDTNCTQNWYPGHVAGDFTVDGDPTVWLLETVDNATDFAWTDYHIAIGMNQSFTIAGVITPLDWTYIITPPEDGLPLPGDEYHGDGWVGYVDYYIGSGDPIGMGGSGDFGIKLVFAGSVEFCTEQVPTPEPATIGLLGLGALVLLRKKK